jgi:hypothetical protein
MSLQRIEETLPAGTKRKIVEALRFNPGWKMKSSSAEA